MLAFSEILFITPSDFDPAPEDVLDFIYEPMLFTTIIEKEKHLAYNCGKNQYFLVPITDTEVEDILKNRMDLYTALTQHGTVIFAKVESNCVFHSKVNPKNYPIPKPGVFLND